MKKSKQVEVAPISETTAADAAEPSPAEIATLAYRLWEQEGRPEGRDLDHWLTAREQLRRGNAPATNTGGQLPVA